MDKFIKVPVDTFTALIVAITLAEVHAQASDAALASAVQGAKDADAAAIKDAQDKSTALQSANDGLTKQLTDLQASEATIPDDAAAKINEFIAANPATPA